MGQHREDLNPELVLFIVLILSPTWMVLGVEGSRGMAEFWRGIACCVWGELCGHLWIIFG